MTMATSNPSNPSSQFNFILEDHLVESSSEYENPLILVPFPPLPCSTQSNKEEGANDVGGANPVGVGGVDGVDGLDILAFGIENGKVYLLPTNSANSANSTNAANAKRNKASSKPRVIRQYDDAVRSLAISPDGLRVAVGFDDGTTKIYCYDDVDVSGMSCRHNHHPFIPMSAINAINANNAANNDGDDYDNDEDDTMGGFSQEDYEEDPPNTLIFEGPRMGSSIRQVAFDPRSGKPCKTGKTSKVTSSKTKKTPYYLAIVSEDGTSPLVVADVTSEETSQKLYLGEEAEREHSGGGVRSVAYTWSAWSSHDGRDSTRGVDTRMDKLMDKMLLATLGMDGRLVSWDVSSSIDGPSLDPSLEWEVCHRDDVACVPKRDPGAGMGGDAGDYACAVKWGIFADCNLTAASSSSTSSLASSASCGDVTACLVLPGKTDIQFRTCPLWKKAHVGKETPPTWECKDWLKKQNFVVEEGSGGGHKDTIVSMALEPLRHVQNGQNGQGKDSDVSWKKRRLVTGGRDGKLLLWEMKIQDNKANNGKDGNRDSSCPINGSYLGELPMNRIVSSSGIPPITSILWTKTTEMGANEGVVCEDVIYAASADGSVMMLRSEGGKFQSVKNKDVSNARKKRKDVQKVKEGQVKEEHKVKEAKEAKDDEGFNHGLVDSDDEEGDKENVPAAKTSKQDFEDHRGIEDDMDNGEDGDEGDDGDDDYNLANDIATQPPEKDASKMAPLAPQVPEVLMTPAKVTPVTPSTGTGRRRLAKKAPTSTANTASDDEDDAIFEEDIVHHEGHASQIEEEDDYVNQDQEQEQEEPTPSKAKNAEVAKESIDASAFIDDEADDADNADDDSDGGVVEYDDANIDIEMAKLTAEKEANTTSGTTASTANALQTENDTEVDNVEPEQDYFDNHDDPLDMDNDHPNSNNYTNYSSFPQLQPPFAPSSTPLEHSRRILCWNHIGVVTLREDGDSGNNIVDISFHETGLGGMGGRRPITFTDNLNFIVGTLGEEGGMFASNVMEEEEDDDDDDLLNDEEFRGLGVMSEATRAAVKRAQRPRGRDASVASAKGSSVYYHRFETFGRNADKDWVVALPDGEGVLGCAAGVGWAGVITSRRYLRLFTPSGLQGPIIWLPGPPVTIVGRHRFVAIIYHRCATPAEDGTQLLGYSILDGMRGSTICTGEVSALSTGSGLKWAGFTDLGALAVMDSEGMVSILSRSSGTSGPNDASFDGNGANGAVTVASSTGDWVPFLDTVGLRKSINDSHWPVEVHGGKLICVLLRGGKEYPDAARRPVTTSLALRLPLAVGLTMKSGPLEDVSIRGNIALMQQKVLNDYMIAEGNADGDALEDQYVKMSAQVDKITLKLFIQVVQAGKVERGLDLVQRLHLEQSHDIAIESADRIGHRKLSDRIEDLKVKRFPPPEERFEEEEHFEDDASLGSHSHHGEGGEEGHEGDGYYDEPVITSRQQPMEFRRSNGPGSPSVPRRHPRNGRNGTPLEEDHTTEEESPPRESLKRKLDQASTGATGKLMPSIPSKRPNPFAKKRMESPPKGILSVKSPTKLKLSRNSTFSSNSRKKFRDGKQIV